MKNLTLMNETIFGPFVGTKVDYVAEVIRTAILIGEYQPTERITEQQVKDSLNISSSPIREAFSKLESEGFLVKVPHIGTLVTSIEIEDVGELFKIHSLLQSTCVQLAVHKLPDEDIKRALMIQEKMRAISSENAPDFNLLRVLNYKLHILICGSNVYPWLTRQVSALWVHLPTQVIWQVPGRPMVSVSQHDKILAMVQARNRHGAARAMKQHLESTRHLLKKMAAQSPQSQNLRALVTEGGKK